MAGDALTLTFAQWRELGGCGLSHLSEHNVCRELKIAPKQMNELTLDRIQTIWIPAGREMARFAIVILNKPEWTALEPEEMED